jgi:hypothetical protein
MERKPKILFTGNVKLDESQRKSAAITQRANSGFDELLARGVATVQPA